MFPLLFMFASFALPDAWARPDFASTGQTAALSPYVFDERLGAVRPLQCKVR